MPLFRGSRVSRNNSPGAGRPTAPSSTPTNSGQGPEYTTGRAIQLQNQIKHHEDSAREAFLRVGPGTSQKEGQHLLALKTEHNYKAEGLKREQKDHDALKPKLGSPPPTAPPQRMEKPMDLSRAPKAPPKQKMDAPKAPPPRGN
jgi:hypothetical protein